MAASFFQTAICPKHIRSQKKWLSLIIILSTSSIKINTIDIRSHIESYYRTERISSGFLFIVGSISIVIAIGYYYWRPSPIAQGLLIGLGLMGLFHCVVGIVRLYRSKQRFALATEDINQQTGHLIQNEYPRIQRKEKTIIKARYLELGILLSCMLFLTLFLFVPYTKSILGTLIGLCIHSAFLFSFDLFSQFRLQEYIHQLMKYLNI